MVEENRLNRDVWSSAIAYSYDPHARLTVAMILDAVKIATRTTKSKSKKRLKHYARAKLYEIEWLKSEDCTFYLDMLDINPEAFYKWLKREMGLDLWP